MRRIVGAGDTVLVEARYRGTVKKTNQKFDVQAAHVWDVKNGKAVKFQQYTDTWKVAELTGFTPKG